MLPSKWNKIGKRKIAKEAGKFMDLMFEYERAYITAMTCLRDVAPNHPIFEQCDEKIIQKIDETLKKVRKESNKKIIIPPGIVAPAVGDIVK